MNWPADQWEVGVPHGKFPTFNLVLKNRDSQSADFHVGPRRIFAGLDIYNDGPGEAVLTIQSPEIRELNLKVKPGELRRLRTGWRDSSSRVIFHFENGHNLRFDNLAFTRE